MKKRKQSYDYSIKDACKAFEKENIIKIGYIYGFRYFDRKTKEQVIKCGAKK
jgi:hypothetical protein